MNNLAAFGEVVNGIRQGMFNLNSKIDQVKNEVQNEINILKTSLNSINNSSPTLQEASVRQWINELEHIVATKLQQSISDIEHQIENIKCQCSTLEQPTEILTVETVQGLIDASLAKLLEGVQPLDNLNVPLIDTIHPNPPEEHKQTQELPPPEPLTDVVVEPVVPQVKTPTRKTPAKRGKKP